MYSLLPPYVLFLSHTHTASDMDYTASTMPSPLTFMAGATVTNNASTSTFVCFTIPITDDIIDEQREDFQLNLTSSSALIVVDGSRADSTAVVFIDDDDIGQQYASMINSEAYVCFSSCMFSQYWGEHHIVLSQLLS